MATKSILTTAVKFSSSVELREKLLKACQYLAKALASTFPAASPQLRTLAKALSGSRRFFVLLRWVKYLDILRDAHAEQHPVVRMLIRAECLLSTVVDIFQDLLTLDAYGLLARAVPKRLELIADQLDTLLAGCSLCLCGVSVIRKQRALKASASLKCSRESEKGGKDGPGAKVLLELRLGQLALLKSLGDLGKTSNAAGMRFAPSERPAAIGTVISSMIAVDKLVRKLK